MGDHGTRIGGGELWQSVVPGSSAVAPTVIADPGWTFTGWDKDFSYIIHDYKDTVVTNGAVHARYSEAVFFSEYVEGSGNNKALEIYNGSSAPVDLAAGYNIQMFFDGSTSPGLTISLTGTIEPGDVYVIAPTSASADILIKADQFDNNSWFDGNDAVVLRKYTTIVDVIGQIGFNPGDQGWGSDPVNTTDILFSEIRLLPQEMPMERMYSIRPLNGRGSL